MTLRYQTWTKKTYAVHLGIQSNRFGPSVFWLQKLNFSLFPICSTSWDMTYEQLFGAEFDAPHTGPHREILRPLVSACRPFLTPARQQSPVTRGAGWGLQGSLPGAPVCVPIAWKLLSERLLPCPSLGPVGGQTRRTLGLWNQESRMDQNSIRSEMQCRGHWFRIISSIQARLSKPHSPHWPHTPHTAPRLHSEGLHSNKLAVGRERSERPSSLD